MVSIIIGISICIRVIIMLVKVNSILSGVLMRFIVIKVLLIMFLLFSRIV